MSQNKKLGVSTLKIRDLMQTDVTSFTMGTHIKDAIAILIEKGISGGPVIDPASKKVLTVISELDLMRFAAMDGLDKPILQFMNKLPAKLVTCKSEDPFSEVFKLFLTHSIRRVIVVDDKEHLVGVVSRRDVMRAFLD